MAKELTAVIPAHNEEAIIARTLREWSATFVSLGIDYEMLVIDDGSTDGTPAILDTLSREMPQLKVRRHPQGLGHGPSILEGYRDAATPWIFQTDSDREMLPDRFDLLWNQRDACDLVIGCRQGRESTPARRLITSVSHLMIGLLYGTGLRDPNAGYRLMRRSAMQPLLAELPADTFAPNLISSGMARKRGLRIGEVDVPYFARQTGQVSIVRWKLWKAAAKSFLQTLRLGFRHLGPSPR